MKISLKDINTGYEGFSQLIELAQQLEKCIFENIEIDLTAVEWIDANMCAPLGAILYRANLALNSISIVNIKPRVEDILTRNGFLCSYGFERKSDYFASTIEYKRFEPKDERDFITYVTAGFAGKDIPKMSSQLSKKFQESIFEIFSNAVIHSETKLGIFACGQTFIKKHRFDFTITDLGIGIRENVCRKIDLNLTAEEAINWAFEKSNTTKKGDIPGGLGLKLLKDFIIKNNGRMQIISDSGYWELIGGKVTVKSLSSSFPGTIVNIEINTADQNSYRLMTEVNPRDIF